jgi:hypothetical protein
MRRIICFLLFVFLLSACTLPQPDANADVPKNLMATVVAATFQAMTPQASPRLPTPETTQTPAPALTPTSSNGKVSGKVCYHDKNMLELTIYFQGAVDNKVWTQSVSRPEENYSLELPVGKYQVYAWPPDYTVGVLSEDHLTIDVAPAQTLTDVDLCDYSKGPFAVPYPPGVSPSKAAGSIAGNVSGYGGDRNLTVVAFNQGTGYWYYVILQIGQTNFSISDLPAGRYQLVVYDNTGITGGTTPTIYVIAGQKTGADIKDWGGDYPPNPVQ